MSPEELRAYRSELGRRGGKARAAQFTSASQRAARKKLSPEKAAANGAKGAAVTIALHGLATVCEASRLKRLEKPSPCELVMIGILSTLGLQYEREYVLAGTLQSLDFYIAAHRLGIEVDGAIHDPGKPGYEKRQEQARRKELICCELNISLIRIHYSELGDDLSGVIHRIQEIAGANTAIAAQASGGSR